ncbi:hypothetical protein SANTM175S_00914 [Streptomyces antimycoticus]
MYADRAVRDPEGLKAEKRTDLDWYDQDSIKIEEMGKIEQTLLSEMQQKAQSGLRPAGRDHQRGADPAGPRRLPAPSSSPSMVRPPRRLQDTAQEASQSYEPPAGRGHGDFAGFGPRRASSTGWTWSAGVRVPTGATSPHNDERWRRAEQVREPAAGGITSSGLPRRVPRANLVEGAAHQPQQPEVAGPQVSRAPDDVRGRLTNLRRGIEQGRRAGTGFDDNHDRGIGPTYQQER